MEGVRVGTLQGDGEGLPEEVEDLVEGGTGHQGLWLCEVDDEGIDVVAVAARRLEGEAGGQAVEVEGVELLLVLRVLGLLGQLGGDEVLVGRLACLTTLSRKGHEMVTSRWVGREVRPGMPPCKVKSGR